MKTSASESLNQLTAVRANVGRALRIDVDEHIHAGLQMLQPHLLAACRRNSRAPRRTREIHRPRSASEILPRDEMVVLAIRLRRAAAGAWCRRRSRQNPPSAAAHSAACFCPRRLARRRQRGCRGGGIAADRQEMAGGRGYSMFWICSRIFSISDLQVTTSCEISTSLALAPSVLNSRPISWLMNSSVRPTGSFLRR